MYRKSTSLPITIFVTSICKYLIGKYVITLIFSLVNITFIIYKSQLAATAHIKKACEICCVYSECLMFCAFGWKLPLSLMLLFTNPTKRWKMQMNYFVLFTLLFSWNYSTFSPKNQLAYKLFCYSTFSNKFSVFSF